MYLRMRTWRDMTHMWRSKENLCQFCPLTTWGLGIKLSSSVVAACIYSPAEVSCLLGVSGIFITEPEERKTVRARGGSEHQGKGVFLTQRGSCTSELTAIVTACTRAAQALARQKAQHKGKMIDMASHCWLRSYWP